MGLFVVLSAGIGIFILCMLKNLCKTDKSINNKTVLLFLYCGILLRTQFAPIMKINLCQKWTIYSLILCLFVSCDLYEVLDTVLGTEQPPNLPVVALRGEHSICGIQMYSTICGTRHVIRRGCRSRATVIKWMEWWLLEEGWRSGIWMGFHRHRGQWSGWGREFWRKMIAGAKPCYRNRKWSRVWAPLPIYGVRGGKERGNELENLSWERGWKPWISCYRPHIVFSINCGCHWRIFKNGEDRSNQQPSQRCRVNWRGETTARCEIRKPCLGTAVEKKESGRYERCSISRTRGWVAWHKTPVWKYLYNKQHLSRVWASGCRLWRQVDLRQILPCRLWSSTG